MNPSYDISIIGGGLAGLTASIHLSKLGYKVLLFERQQYPHHKVCGEYISNEVLPYLDSLGIQLPMDMLPRLARLLLTTKNGKQLGQQLPLGGFGISRYKLDEILYHHAKQSGVQFHFQKVESILYHKNLFSITTNEKQVFHTSICLGAWGKRSSLDKTLKRPFIQKNSAWMAVKCHYESEFDSDLIALHNFRGGYCGMSKVEDDVLNVCYLVDTKVFQEFGNVSALENAVLHQNPYWSEWRQSAKPIFSKPLVISQVSFEKKDPVEDHILMIGDSAGLIHPLCGNGMAMAIHGAKLAVDAIHNYYQKHKNREILEADYQTNWVHHFKSRLVTGRRIQALLLQQQLSPLLIQLAQLFPGLIPKVIRKTHGKPISANL